MIPDRAIGALETGGTIAAPGAEAQPPHSRAYAVEREAVIAMLERERRSLSSSLIALAMMAVAIAFLPEPGFMAVLLALRAASFVFTRESASALERRVRRNLPLARARRVLVGAMTLTGVTLALMLWPQPPSAPRFAVVMLQMVVLVAVTLIPVTLAALPRARDAMLAAFWVTSSVLLVSHADASAALVGVLGALVLGVRVYSASTGQHIVSSAAILIENRKLSEELADALSHAEYLSTRDPLTRLFNRNKLFEVALDEGEARRRCLLTIDLDHFKAINDRFGHAAGDDVLVASAEAVRAWIARLTLLREPIAFRLGGEEFLILVEDMGEEELLDAAEALRRAIEGIARRFPEYPGLVVTASIGMAAWHRGEALDAALVRADLACYDAKAAGRNRVARAG